jgi:short-subunit dehydrogenase
MLRALAGEIGVTRRLAGRVALVTGASSGIGLATARALAASGARLALVSRSQARLEAAAPDIEAVGDSPPLLLPCDVSDPAAVLGMASRMRRDLGAPDILVNNAGIGHWAAVADLPVERIRDVFDVNVFGAIHCTKAFLPDMVERRRGTVVFVSSGLGVLPFPYSAAYCASKHALNGFAGSLRAEVEPLGVNVLLVLPGGTRTAFFDANAYPAHMLSRYLFQRLDSPERVARRIVDAVTRGRRRIVVGRFNDLGLRLLSALPEIQATFLAMVGRRISRRERASGTAPRRAR